MTLVPQDDQPRNIIPMQPATGLGEGMDGLDQSDLILPRKSIIQSTSKKVLDPAKAGQFTDNLSGEVVPTVNAVLIRVDKVRLLWSGNLTDTAPECSSPNGHTSRDGQVCAQCHYNPEFNQDLWENDGMKRCDKGYQFLCADPNDESLFLLGAMRTSVKPVRLLISQFAARRRPLFSALVEFRTELVANDKGKFYVLKPVIAKQLDPVDIAHWRTLYQAMQGIQVTDIEPEGATAEDSPF